MGYRRKDRTKEVVFENWDHEDGSEPFRATIRTNLTFEEVDAIDLRNSTTFKEIFAAVAPHVLAWNVERENLTTGEWEPVPPPAEAGPDAFLTIEHALVVWLAQKVKYAYLGDAVERKKEQTPPDSTDAMSSDGDSASAAA